jgi:hypothetical protein
MIVVSELNEGIVDRVLRQLYAEGQLEALTIPLVWSGATNKGMNRTRIQPASH